MSHAHGRWRELLPATINVLTGAAALATDLVWSRSLPMPAGFARIGGLSLVYVGLGLVVWAGAHLRGAIRGMVSPVLPHLVTSGPYRLVRHPVYLGTSVAMIGVALVSRSLLGLVLTVLLFVPGEVHRARREEDALSKAFGENWAAYAGRTPFIVPRPWSGSELRGRP